MVKPKGIKVDAITLNVKYKGVFHFREVYRNMQEWVMDRGFTNPDNFGFQETYYQEKRTTGKMARTAWSWWRVSYAEEGTTYYTRNCDVDFHLRFLKDIDVMYEGKKFQMHKGEIEVIMNGYIMIDAQGAWRKHWFLKHIHELYHKRIWAKRKEVHINRIRGDLYYIQNHLKAMLKLKTFQKPISKFYPEMADHSIRM